MTFTDDDLKRLKEYPEETYICFGNHHLLFDKQQLKALLTRLKAAEEALLSCKRYQYDDGLVIVEPPHVEKYEAWHKAAGK